MSEEDNKFVPHSHFPYGPDGFGFYSGHRLLGYYTNNEAIPFVVEAVKSSDIKTNTSFTVVDYGTADGGTSMPLMYACVKAIREKYGDQLPINIIYEDQPVNDFKSLFMRLQGLIPGPTSYLADFENVYVLASGTNFYEQCFPSNSVNLGFANTCFHWLSKKPCELSDAIVCYFSEESQEKEAYAKQAEEDWERILLKRAAELIPGGKLIVATFMMTDHCGFNMFQLLSTIWKDLANESIITKDEFKSTNLIVCGRSTEDFKRPFESPDSPVSQAGLKIVSMETKTIPCHLHKEYQENKDPKEYAKRFTLSCRAWGNSTFTSGLSSTRSDEEKSHIVDELYRRFEVEVERNPDRYQDEWLYAYITIQKQI